MKLKPIIAAMPIMFTLLTGCTTDPQTHSLSMQWPFHSAAQNAATNGEIVEKIIALDQAEIATTHYAAIKANHPKVRHFAVFLHHAHEKNLHRIRHFSHKHHITPVENTVANDIKRDGRQELAELKTLAHIDKVFLKDIIHDHEDALNLIDRAILQSTNKHLTVHLKELRHHFAEHLVKAERLQKELNLG
jgi:predicted outer membrane protein